LPVVKVADQQHDDERHHAAEHGAFQDLWVAAIGVGDDVPWIQEQQLDVKHQEHDGDEIELDVEALARVADRLHAGFVGDLFTLGIVPWNDDMDGDQSANGKNEQQSQVGEDGIVGAEIELRLVHQARSGDIVNFFTNLFASYPISDWRQ